MAFSGKRTAVAGDYDFYGPNDPAFDRAHEKFDHEKAHETRDFETYLPRKNGVTPWRFVLRRLSSQENEYLRDVGTKHGGNSLAWWAVALGVRKVVDPQGQEEFVDRVAQNGVQRIVDEWIDAIVDDRELFLAMANQIILREILGSPK